MPSSGTSPTSRTPRITPQSVATAADCSRRLWLKHNRPDAAAATGELQLVLRERASAHERAVVGRFTDLVGPLWKREGSFADAAGETLRLLREGQQPLYQPAFLSADGRRSSVPDFAWWDGDVLVITDVRLALRPETRPDFALQLAHHRALVRECAQLEPGRFEIVNGYGKTIAVTPASESTYAAALRLAEATLSAAEEPDDLLAHSACRSCDFYSHCWNRAEAERRIEILPEVQCAHVPGWRARGVRTLEQLAAFDATLPVHGVPAALARRAVVAAGAWRDNRAIWLHAPALPAYPVVWFDLEGDSRGEDAEIPIYLWGFALDPGAEAPRSEAIVAEFAAGGDQRSWERFVARAEEILATHPGIRWVHWDNYEPLWVRRYAEQHGAPAGFLERMNAACFDLKRVLDRSVRLPLRSYSIKHVARWMGFAWRNPESGSEWSTARFHRARSTADDVERQQSLAELAEYNEDDLLAMRAIWRWLAVNAPVP